MDSISDSLNNVHDLKWLIKIDASHRSDLDK